MERMPTRPLTIIRGYMSNEGALKVSDTISVHVVVDGITITQTEPEEESEPPTENKFSIFLTDNEAEKLLGGLRMLYGSHINED